MMIGALRNSFNPSIGPKRSLIDRWSCSMRLFNYFEDRILVPFPRLCSFRNSRAARRGLIAIKRDGAGQPTLVLERSSKKRFGRSYISLGAKQEIDGLSFFIDRAIEVVHRPLIFT